MKWRDAKRIAVIGAAAAIAATLPALAQPHLAIGVEDVERSQKVDALEVKQTTATDEVGNERDYNSQPNAASPPPLPALVVDPLLAAPVGRRPPAGYAECQSLAADGVVSETERVRWTALDCRRHQ